MSKISKNFKLSRAAITCLEIMQKNTISKEGEFTQTEVIEQALFHYLASVHGEKMLADIVMDKKIDLDGGVN